MSLQVLLDQPGGRNQVYCPGHKVSGKVIFRIAGQEKVDDVHVIFKGVVLNHITTGNGNSRQRHNEKIVLFRSMQSLFRGPYTISAQAMEWPFEFRFPESVSHARNRDGGYIPDGTAQLPPDFQIKKGIVSDQVASVTYSLKIHVNKGTFTRHVKQIVPLQFTPMSLTLTPLPAIFERPFDHERWTSNDLRQEKHTFKQKWSHVFSDNPEFRTPSIGFRASLHMPGGLAPGQSTPLSFSLKHNISTPNDPPTPTLMLERVSFALQATTDWICGSTFRNLHKDSKDDIGTTAYRLREVLPLDGTEVFFDQAFSMSKFGLVAKDCKTYTHTHLTCMQIS